MFEKISDDQLSNVHRCPVSFAKTVVSVGVNHVIKRLTEFDQPINQPFDNLNVSIGFARTGNYQQLAF